MQPKSVQVLVRTPNSSVLAAIELDDKSHARRSRVETDSKKDKATAAAGVRLIRWQVKSLPDEAAIKAAFVQLRGTALEGTSPGRSRAASNDEG